jgi:hypothetical protein
MESLLVSNDNVKILYNIINKSDNNIGKDKKRIINLIKKKCNHYYDNYIIENEDDITNINSNIIKDILKLYETKIKPKNDIKKSIGEKSLQIDIKKQTDVTPLIQTEPFRTGTSQIKIGTISPKVEKTLVKPEVEKVLISPNVNKDRIVEYLILSNKDKIDNDYRYKLKQIDSKYRNLEIQSVIVPKDNIYLPLINCIINGIKYSLIYDKEVYNSVVYKPVEDINIILGVKDIVLEIDNVKKQVENFDILMNIIQIQVKNKFIDVIFDMKEGTSFKIGDLVEIKNKENMEDKYNINNIYKVDNINNNFMKLLKTTTSSNLIENIENNNLNDKKNSIIIIENVNYYIKKNIEDLHIIYKLSN